MSSGPVPPFSVTASDTPSPKPTSMLINCISVRFRSFVVIASAPAPALMFNCSTCAIDRLNATAFVVPSSSTRVLSALTVKTSARAEPVTVSTSVPGPFPPSIRSSPSPSVQKNWSESPPPIRVSAPVPPMSTSFPSPPIRVSSLARPLR